ncbi:hypothetical protein DLJ49_14790 [Rhodovulum sp. 12E13]|uniref:hypothetical protein n=1 Tax=Rhodovulum sp. 12E13 TaxID=2203891 RepID=UPI000E1178B6|nr:hypothetical protein [Rhodovulum sp. 12E13]RDC71473.1 hypothetical protein DLJ49_14790 [Rhodovulum sp. 12E13]
MPHQTPEIPPAAAPFLAGSLAVLAGSAAALWAPASVATLLALVALLRVCWIDENIRGDLEHAKRIPAGYVNTIRLRHRLSTRLFGATPSEITCPRMLASQMRAQGHALFAFIFGLAAALIAAGAGETPLGLVGAGAALILAFRRVDRLALTDAHLRRGEPLPVHLLDDRGGLSRLVTNAPATDGGEADEPGDAWPAPRRHDTEHRHETTRTRHR